MPCAKPQPSAPDPRLTHVGVNYRHDPGFTIDRPRGAGFYFFLRLFTPVIMRCASGMRRLPAGRAFRRPALAVCQSAGIGWRFPASARRCAHERRQ